MELQAITETVISLMLGFLIWENGRLHRLTRIFQRRECQLREHLETDPLTGLGNRLTITRLQESTAAVTGVVAVLDVDDMKRVNDELGHLAGDEVLGEVGNLIRASIRRDDIACRWGGDEFLVLFRNQSVATVEERLREVERRLWSFRLRALGVFPLRISWGVAKARGTRWTEVLAVADERMYEMKRCRKKARYEVPPRAAADQPNSCGDRAQVALLHWGRQEHLPRPDASALARV